MTNTNEKDQRQAHVGRKFSAGLLVLLLAAIILGLTLLSLALFLFTGCTAPPASSEAKYVFVFVGDGMGLNHLTATRYFQQARDGTAGESPWKDSFDGFPYIGLMSTHSRSQVTDSAAAITAMLSGHKANNGTINIDPDTNGLYRTFAKAASMNGYAVGVVTSTSVDHATPAGVYANADDRYEYDAIARQGLAPDYLRFLGGGGFRGSDSDALRQLAVQNGFTVAETPEAIRALTGETPVLALSNGGVNDHDMAYELDRLRAANYGGDTVSLAEMLKKAIECLMTQERFVLFCESAMVDIASADQDVLGALYEVQALDDAVQQALTFYEAHPDDTLIVVLADHETGGLRIRGNAGFTKLQRQIATYTRFVSIMEELYDENADFDQAMEKASHYFGLPASGLDEDTLAAFQKAYEKSLAGADGLDPFANALCNYISEEARVGFDTTNHTGTAVPVYAKGKFAELFAGVYDNTQIYAKLCESMGMAAE